MAAIALLAVIRIPQPAPLAMVAAGAVLFVFGLAIVIRGRRRGE